MKNRDPLRKLGLAIPRTHKICEFSLAVDPDQKARALTEDAREESGLKGTDAEPERIHLTGGLSSSLSECEYSFKSDILRLQIMEERLKLTPSDLACKEVDRRSDPGNHKCAGNLN